MTLGAVSRRLLAQPALMGGAIACLALGVGANTAMYSVLHPMLLEPLPFQEPQRLVVVWSQYPSSNGAPTDYYTTTENFVRFDRTTSFELIAGVLDLDFDVLNEGSDPERVLGAQTSVALFDVTGTDPIMGRVFSADDAVPGHDAVVVIGEDLWERRFARSPSVVGSELVVDGTPRTVVGVVSTGSAYPLRSSLWIPLVPDAMSPERLQRGMLTLVARTGQGLSLEAVQADLDGLARVLRDELPERNRNLGFRVEALRETLVSDARPAMLGLMVGVGLLLAIACANVANLLLVRVDRERWEIAIRMSLGASTRDVVARSLSESLGLALIAGAVGVAMAYAALGPLVAMVPDDTFGLEDVRISGSVLLFSSLMSILTVLVFGMVPAIVASGAAPGDALRSASGGSGVGSKVQSRFVVVQAGVGVVLLVSAGLVFQSVARLQRIDPGFETGDHLTFRLMAPEARYPGHPARLAFFRRVLEEVRAIPGVDRAAGAHVLPIGDVAWGYAHSVEDLPPANPGDQYMSFLRVVTPEYFATMGTPLIEGRDFDERDNLESLPVAIVSRRAAEAYWPDQEAVGMRIKRGAYGGENPWVTVIGVVENVRDGGLAEDPALTIYLPYAQQDNSYTTFMSVVMRAQARVGIAEVSARVQRVDPTVALFRVRILEEVVTASLRTKRSSAVLLTLFGIMGALLTALGVYGVTEHAASQRRREMAIRLALGAGGASVGGLLLRRALGLASLGAVLGLAALGLMRLTSLTELIGIGELDGTVLVGATLAVCAVAVLSCLRPSWKAATLEPAVVLRGD